MEYLEVCGTEGVINGFCVASDRRSKGGRDRTACSGGKTSVFGDTEGKVPLCLTDIPHLTMRTVKLIDNV